MPTSQPLSRFATLLCFALFFGISSCSTDNVSCDSNYCLKSINFYANGIDSKTIVVALYPDVQVDLSIYISKNEQDINLKLSSDDAIINSTVSVNSKLLFQPGNAYSWSGDMKLSRMISPIGHRFIRYNIKNEGYMLSYVIINLDITRIESSSNANTASHLIAIIVPTVVSLLAVAALSAWYIRRRRNAKTRQGQPSITVRPLDPISISPKPIQDQQKVSYGFPQSPQGMTFVQNVQYYSNQNQHQYQYTQVQYIQGHNQGQAVYYMPQNQSPTYVMQA